MLALPPPPQPGHCATILIRTHARARAHARTTLARVSARWCSPGAFLQVRVTINLDTLLYDTEDHKAWAAHERQAAAATAATQAALPNASTPSSAAPQADGVPSSVPAAGSAGADAAEMSASAAHWPDEHRSPVALLPPLASRAAESDSRAVALLRHRQGLASQLQVVHPEEAAPSELVRVAETGTAETVEGLPVILCLRYRPLPTPAICATILIRTHARARTGARTHARHLRGSLRDGAAPALFCRRGAGCARARSCSAYDDAQHTPKCTRAFALSRAPRWSHPCAHRSARV